MSAPAGSRFEVLDRFSLRTRIGVLAALAAALSVVLVSAAAFFTVRANILDALDANLLQRATAAARSDLVNPQQLASIPTEVFGVMTSTPPEFRGSTGSGGSAKRRA